MDIQEFKKFKAGMKPFNSISASDGYKVKFDKDRLSCILIRKEKCSKCGKLEGMVITVSFNEKQERLTIFQAEMIISMWGMGRTPYQYGNYHSCPAGKQFIENIKEVSVLKM